MYYEGDLSTLYYNITVKSDSKLSVSATPSGGTISPGEKVTLSSNSSGAIIYYTLDGSTPTTNSSVYTTAGITINNDCTLKAIATKSGYTSSDVLSATYTVSSYEKYSVGDIFTAKSEEGIELSFRVTGIAPKTCEMYWCSPGLESSGKVTIPSSVNGYAVTNIGVNAFVGWKNIDTVVIPNSVEIISDNAFTGCSLSSIVIPTSVTNIGKRAFENCDRLMDVVIPNSVENLGERAFFNCDNLSSVEVGAVNIGSSAFSNCHSLESLDLQDGVISIGESAFFYCENIHSAYISNTIESIDDHAFFRCLKFPNINLPSSLKKIGDSAFCMSGITDIVIPNSVTYIGPSAFAYTNIKTVSLPNSIRRIESKMFRGSHKLANISGGNKIEYVAPDAIEEDCPWIENLPEGKNFLGKVLFKYVGDMSENTTLDVIGGCTQIYKNAICGSVGLVEVNIPASITAIGEGNFFGCPNLHKITVDAANSVYDSRNECNAIIEKDTNMLIVGCSNSTIPNSVISIGSYAFYGNWTKDEILIPNQIDSIAGNAFSNNSNVKSILIGKGMRKMGSNVFNQLPHLKEIAVSTSNPYFDSRDNCNAIIEKATNTLVVGCSTTTIPNTVKTIGSYAFYGNGDEDFTSLVIPNSVEEIKSYAFDSLPYLREVSIGTNVKTFGNYMFYKCNNLEAIESLNGFPDDIDEKVFDSGSEDFSIYDTVTLYVPAGCRNNYRLATGWSNFKNIVEGSLLVGVDDVLLPQPKEEVIYSPTGVRLSAPQRGVNIVNGKKLLVK